MESAIRGVFRPNRPVWSTFDRHLGLKCVPTGQFWPQAMENKVLQIIENHNFTSNGTQDKHCCWMFHIFVKTELIVKTHLSIIKQLLTYFGLDSVHLTTPKPLWHLVYLNLLKNSKKIPLNRLLDLQFRRTIICFHSSSAQREINPRPLAVVENKLSVQSPARLSRSTQVSSANS